MTSVPRTRATEPLPTVPGARISTHTEASAGGLQIVPAVADATLVGPDSSTILVSVVVPTRNEQENLPVLVHALDQAFGSTPWELVLADDSDDDTPQIATGLAESGHELRLVHRPLGQREGGLAGAVHAGFAVARGDVFVVMDADLQHPPAIAPGLASIVASDLADIALASRYVPGGSSDGLDGPMRVAVSHGARMLTRIVLPRTRGVRDPLGGFFAVRREVVEGIPLTGEGFKILMEVLDRGRWSRVVEVPYAFGKRRMGLSNATFSEGKRYLKHLARLRTHRAGATDPSRGVAPSSKR